MSKKLSRRDFLKGAAAELAVLGLAGCAVKEAQETPSATPSATPSVTPAPLAASAGLYTPGTYSATVKGYASFITVKMTFSADAITDCAVDAAGETAAIGQVAAEELQKLIVESQSADVTSAASAAITVPAIKKAAQNCIAQAQGAAAPLNENAGDDGEDWLGVAPVIDESQLAETRTTDLLIIGAGNGGMMAAATAADAGLDFMICEQNPVLAESRHWVGAVNSRVIREAGLTVDKNRLMNELGRYASYKCDLGVLKLWLNHSGEMVDYLESLGLTAVVNPAPTTHVGGDGMEYYVPTTWHTLATAEEFAACPQPPVAGNRNKFLEQHIQKKGYAVSYGMALVRLVQDDSGRVTGAIFTDPDGKYIKVSAKNTILATGGYAGNSKMINALAPIVGETVTANFFYAPDRGMGIRAGMWAGAKKQTEPAYMIFDRGIVAPKDAKAGYVDDGHGGLTFPSPMDQFILGSQPYLKVNKEGQRFANESLPYDFINFTAAYQTDGVYACIMDANVTDDIIAYDQYGCAKMGVFMAQAGGVIPTLEESVAQGLVCKADTIEELGQKLGIPADTLAATVKRYNELCAKGVDEDYGKEAYRMRPVAQSPFYGYFLGGSLLTTMDGLQINEKCQVIKSGRQVVEGLYSIGDCSGSFFSGNYPEYIVGVAVGRTLTEGRYAVKAILGEQI